MFAFKPYGYQQDALNALSGAVARGLRRLLLVMATGTGKSVVMALFASQQRRGRILVLAHQTEILDQLARTFADGMDPHTQGTFNGRQKDMHHVDVLFATFQTMAEWHQAFQPDEFDIVIVDESHHGPAPTYMPVIEHFKPRILIGATGTPSREDSGDVIALFGGEPVYSLPLELALAYGYLTPPRYYVLSDEIANLDVLQTPVGQLSVALLNRTLFVPKRDEEIIRLIGTKCTEAGINQPRTLVFTRSIPACEHFAALMAGAVAYHSGLSRDAREQVMLRFRAGEITTLVTIDMVNEGIDLPGVNVLVFLRGTSSRNIFFQQLGRGLRRAPGKTQVLVLDFVSNCQRLEDLEKLKSDITRLRSDAVPAQADPSFSVDTGDIVFDAAFYDILATLARIREGYSDEVLIDLLQTKAKELGRSPTVNDLQNDRQMPHFSTYVDRWGKWSDALAAAGLTSRPVKAKYTDEELIGALKAKAAELGKTLTHLDIGSDPKMPAASTYLKRWGSIGKALQVAGLVQKTKTGLSGEDLLELLRQKAQHLGRTPTQKDVESDPRMPSSTTYAKRWGSYNKAIDTAGLARNTSVVLSDEELLELLRQKAQHLGRTPSTQDIADDPKMPSQTPYMRIWGSYRKAVIAAGLTPNKPGRQLKEQS